MIPKSGVLAPKNNPHPRFGLTGGTGVFEQEKHMTQPGIVVTKTDLGAMIAKRLSEAGLSADQADIVADILVYAELRGVASHGALRMEHYVNRIKKGGINLQADFAIEQVKPTMGRLDAKGGMGHIATFRAAEAAIAIARVQGMGAVGVLNNSHNGVMAYYANMALQAKMACFICSNVNSLVAPFGGVKPYLGSNPLAFSFPGRKENILLDMATSEVAFGKILEHRVEKKPLAPTWALDTEGNPTTDPDKAEALTSFGGAKGYGIGIMLEALTSLMIGGFFGPQLEPMYGDLAKYRNLATFVLVINPAVFGGERFLDTAQAMIDDLHRQPAAPGFSKVMIPGEIEENNIRRHEKDGITLPGEVYEYLSK